MAEMCNTADKAWIDGASLEELLRRWRYAPIGDPIFQGDIGAYYSKVVRERRDADPAEYTRASKAIDD